jgi:hypothetical protein
VAVLTSDPIRACLSPKAWRLYKLIEKLAENDGGACVVGQLRLGEIIGISVGQVGRYVGQLRAAGLISVKHTNRCASYSVIRRYPETDFDPVAEPELETAEVLLARDPDSALARDADSALARDPDSARAGPLYMSDLAFKLETESQEKSLSPDEKISQWDGMRMVAPPDCPEWFFRACLRHAERFCLRRPTDPALMAGWWPVFKPRKITEDEFESASLSLLAATVQPKGRQQHPAMLLHAIASARRAEARAGPAKAGAVATEADARSFHEKWLEARAKADADAAGKVEA